MGELIVMPSRTESEAEPVRTKQLLAANEPGALDLSIWKRAPRERTPEYFPTYSAVSKAMQGALRAWVRERYHAHTEIQHRPHTEKPNLV